jgi:hypothetical protein
VRITKNSASPLWPIGNKRALVREDKRKGSNDQGKAEIVPEHVVELIVPVRWACGIPRGKIDKDAEAINV